MKLKIHESKIRRVVQEELLKDALNKTIKEQKWPSYAAYLLAEILMLEYSATTEKTKKEMVEQHGMDEKSFAEWVSKNASTYGLPDSDVQEAKEILGQSKGAGQAPTGEGAKGFFKAFAKPYVNLYKAFTNITQQAVNLTDPEKGGDPENKDDVQAAAQVQKNLKPPAELKQANEDELMAYVKQVLAILQKSDSAIDGDALGVGEKELDGLGAELKQGVGAAAGGAEAGGEEAGAGEQTAAIYRGKGGIGLQSHLAKAGISGKAMGAVLKHIEKQLKAQGVTVSEGILDEVQGHILVGLVEGMLQEHYGQPITIEELLKEYDGLGRKSAAGNRKGSLARTSSLRSARQSLAREKGMKGAIAGEEPEREDPAKAGREEPPEKVERTVKNTAPEGAATIKVFKGKGGEGLQSALARSRDKFGIKQQQVAAIIKQVEIWANKNQIKVENISEDTFDSILSELSSKYQARRLQEAINKLKNV